jgi:hypothetical protein
MLYRHFKFYLTIRLQESPRKLSRLELNETNQLLVYVDDINLLGDNTIKQNTETLLESSRDVGLEINA